MSYYGFGIQSMAYQQKPRKVFTTRFENKGRDIQLKGALSLVKLERLPVRQTVPDVQPSFGLVLIAKAIRRMLLGQRATI